MENKPNQDDTLIPLTRWTLITRAARSDDASTKIAALDELCRIYWYPAYCLMRHRGLDVETAKDGVQQFFLQRVLNGSLLLRAEESKGRFRMFFRTAVKNFALNIIRDDSKLQYLELDGFDEAESLFSKESLCASDDADRESDKAFAQALLRRAQARLGREEMTWAAEASVPLHQIWMLMGNRAEAKGYFELAQALGITEGALKVRMHRLRRRFGEIIREEVAQVTPKDEVEAELRYFLTLFGSEV